MKKQPDQRRNVLIVEIFIWISIIILVSGALAALSFQIEALTFHYPLDYGEAPLINQAMQLNAGHPIYQKTLEQPPYTIANYPPVYIGLLAVFEKIFGPAFWYGRLISSLGMIGSAVMINLIIKSRAHDWKLALVTALLFFNIPYVIQWSTLARIDHLALFFALTGLYLIFRKSKSYGLLEKGLILGSIFLLLAIFTRQSYALAAPFAAFLYLFQKDWKRAAVLTGLVGGMTLILFVLINWLTEGGFYFNIVTANINPFGFERVVNNFRDFFDMAPILFVLSVVGILFIFKNVDGWPLVVGFTFGGFLSAITIGKIGSNINYFLEFSAGLSLLVGFGLLVLVHGSKKTWLAVFSCAVLLLVSWQTVQFIEEIENNARGTLDTRKEAFEELQEMEALVSENLDQPILADEYMGMITLNEKKLYLQPFEVTQLAISGLFDQQILIDQIKEEEFSLILLQEDSWWVHALQERWTPEMLEAIRGNYRLVGQYESTFAYKPRSTRRVETLRDCPGGFWSLPTNATMGYRYESGWLSLYGAGAEGVVPVEAIAPGEVYRPEQFPVGSLIAVHDDPLNPGERVIVYYTEMRAFRDGEPLIAEIIPVGAEGLAVDTGEVIGYQSMWAGRTFQQDWLHVTLGIAPFSSQFLQDPDLLEQNLLHPGTYFGIQINADVGHIQPVTCLD